MITDDQIKQIRELASLATSDVGWWIGSHRAQSIEDAEKWCGDALRHRPEHTEMFMVYSQKDWSEVVSGDALIVALTGNGKNAENNARFIAAMSPSNTLLLLDEIERLRVTEKS